MVPSDVEGDDQLEDKLTILFDFSIAFLEHFINTFPLPPFKLRLLLIGPVGCSKRTSTNRS